MHDNILDSDEESLLGNYFDLSGVDRAYGKRTIRCCQPDMTNPRTTQVKITKPTDYYASRYQKLTVSEMKAFIGVCLSMEYGVTKRRYELYFEKKSGFLLILLVIELC